MKKVIKLTERDLINIIRRVIKEQEVDEDRLDYESMSDEELHDFHPEIKKHPRQNTGHVIQTESRDNDTALPLVGVLVT